MVQVGAGTAQVAMAHPKHATVAVLLGGTWIDDQQRVDGADGACPVLLQDVDVFQVREHAVQDRAGADGGQHRRREPRGWAVDPFQTRLAVGLGEQGATGEGVEQHRLMGWRWRTRK